MSSGGKQLSFQAAAPLVLLATGLSLVIAVELAAGNGFLRAMLAGQLPLATLFMVLLMVVASTGAIINAFNAATQTEPVRVAGTVASCCLALLAGIEASHAMSRLPIYFYFGASWFAQTAFAYCTVRVVLSLLKLSGRWQTHPPLLCAAALCVLGTLGLVGQSFFSLERTAQSFSLLRDIGLLACTAGPLLAVSFVKKLRLDPRSMRESLRLRLPNSPREGSVALAVALLGAVLDVLFHGLSELIAPSTYDVLLARVGLFSFAWLGVVVHSFVELTLFSREQKQGNVTSKLATASARRFLERNLSDRKAWAATVGLRTTIFNIDHDPGNILHTRLPASVMQIRSEEIQRCISEVLGPMYLHSNVVGGRSFGVLDPEISLRPCIDALKMFSCLYLDAGPLVERRIKGLTSLLPIVDPGLARILKPHDLASLIRRNLWFFYFDFGWIDQHVVHTPRSTRYDVRISSLSSRIRHSMIDHLERTGGIGNFVWIGPAARDRLLQEAPSLKNIVETCPIPAADGGDEMLMFVIKFEQLIPRLQRYFDLDSMRRSLADFEPSAESAQLLELLHVQIARAGNPESVLDVLSSLISVPWKGFKEKDHALQIILAAFEKVNQQLDPGGVWHEARSPEHGAIYAKILDAVRAVGYPSKMLHDAQVNKIALRDVEALCEAASSSRHPRFHEAWLLLGTADFARYSPEQRCQLLAFVSRVAQGGLFSQVLVQAKSIDALAGLGRFTTEREYDAVQKALASLGQELARRGAEADVCSLFLDVYTFISMHLDQAFALGSPTVSALDGHFDALRRELGANSPKLIALMSRWQELRSRAEGLLKLRGTSSDAA